MSIEEKLKKESFKEYAKEKGNKLLEYVGKNELVSDLNNYPHAFVLACFMDRQINAERAWAIPYEIKEIVGSFDIDVLGSISLDEYKKIFLENNLHRFNKDMAEVFYKAVHRIIDDYNGDASNIWKNKPNSATVVSRFLEFDGVGIKIATMAVNLLTREYGIELSDYSSIDISPDIHVKRVFKRMGLVSDVNNVDKITYKARAISPEFPGILDLTCWKLGKDICRPVAPRCDVCKFRKECPKLIEKTNFN